MSAAPAVHLACGEVPVLLGDAGDPQGWLSDSERARMAAFASEARRAQFLAVRWQARWLLSQAFGGAPAGWMLEAPHDAPPQVRGRADLFLSVSHSGERVASALGTQAVGVDLEQPRRARDLAGLVALCCTPREQAALDEAGDREALFFTLWTAKEAWLKRRLEGVSPRRLAQIECRPDQDGEVRTWAAGDWRLAVTSATPRWWTPAPSSCEGWRVEDLAAPKP